MRRSNPFSSLPKFHRGAFLIFIVATTASMILADQPVAPNYLLLSDGFSSEWMLWQPLSACFMYPNGQLGGLFFTLGVQWFLGGRLEKFWGLRRYLLFTLGCGVLAYLLTGLLGFVSPAIQNLSLGGTTPIDLAVVAAFGVLFARQPLQLFGVVQVSSHVLAIFVVALTILAPLARGAPWPQVIPYTISLLIALLIVTQPWRKLLKKKPRKRPNLRLISNGPSMSN